MLLVVSAEIVEGVINYQLEHLSIMMYIIYSFNAMWQEMIFAITLGMRICGLAIRTEDGNKPTKKQIFIRNLVYPLDTLLVIGSVGLNKPNGRSLGDYISKTKLVRIKDLKD